MTIVGRVAAFLDQAGLPYDIERDDAVLRLSFVDGDTGLGWTCLAFGYDDEDLLVFFSLAPDDVPPDRRTAVAEYLTRVNYGLPVGNFEMDLADGEVRCRTSVAVADAPLTSGVIRAIIETNLGLMRRYLPGLIDVVSGDADPERSVHDAEARDVLPPRLGP